MPESRARTRFTWKVCSGSRDDGVGCGMIIIPEIETVVILVPRTGSGALRRAVAAKYPKSMLVYRHMEADGIPLGYDRWPRVGVVRNPLDRLWSLYKFLRNFGGNHDPAFILAMHASVARPFDDWLLNNEIVFTSPYDRAGLGRYWPGYSVRHPIPENRKSQFVYLRPDLGTEIHRTRMRRLLRGWMSRLGARTGLRPNLHRRSAKRRNPTCIAALNGISAPATAWLEPCLSG